MTFVDMMMKHDVDEDKMYGLLGKFIATGIGEKEVLRDIRDDIMTIINYINNEPITVDNYDVADHAIAVVFGESQRLLGKCQALWNLHIISDKLYNEAEVICMSIEEAFWRWADSKNIILLDDEDDEEEQK